MPRLSLAFLALLAATLALGAPPPASPSKPPPFEGQLSGHASHACLLRPTHDVVCWGLDLQNSRLEQIPTGQPALVPGLNDATEIAVGMAHACAIRQGGHVACWGYDGLGQLGTPPEKAIHLEPVEVPALADAVHLASSAHRTCAVRQSGHVSCWGSWDANVAYHPEVTDLPGIEDAREVVMADTHGCALRADGHVACWGDNQHGQAGTGQRSTQMFDVQVPAAVANLDDAVHLTAARLDTCALRKSGQIACWGDRSGQLLPADKRGPATPFAPVAAAPVAVPGVQDASAVMLTDTAGCYLKKKDGQLACWWPLLDSWDQREYARTHPTPPRLTDVKLPALARSTRQLISAEETYALVKGGKVLHWGGRAIRQPTLPVKGLHDAIDVGTGTSQSCALRKGGNVVCWGAIGSGLESSGTDGQLAARFSPVPVAVSKVKDAVQLSVGGAHACVLDKAGAVLCWGANNDGQLGNGRRGAGLSAAIRAKAKAFSPFPPPELLPREAASRVTALGKAVQVASGLDSSCAVLASGQVACWGANTHGQLGNGSTAPSVAPSTVVGISDAVRVAVGQDAACAIRKDGSLMCWGRDRLSLTGTGNEGDDIRFPAAVPGITGAVDVALADGATCAVLGDGTSRCWGKRSRYLGDGDSSVQGTAQVAVRGVSDALALRAGIDQRCVLHKSGTVSCWGHNLYGVLGEGTRVDRWAPTDVLGLSGVQALSAGDQQSCAVRGGEVVCWGAHALGALGDGRDASAPSELALELATLPAAVAAPVVPNVAPAAAAPHP